MKYYAIIIIVLLASCYSKEPEKTGMEGKPVPGFELLLMDSTKTLNTENIVQGKPFIFFFFGPNCPYSRAQMKSIVEKIDKLKDIDIYAISSESFLLTKKFSELYKLEKFKNITTGFDAKNTFANYMNLQAVPYIAIYDKNKNLKRSFLGETDIDLIRTIAIE